MICCLGRAGEGLRLGDLECRQSRDSCAHWRDPGTWPGVCLERHRSARWGACVYRREELAIAGRLYTPTPGRQPRESCCWFCREVPKETVCTCVDPGRLLCSIPAALSSSRGHVPAPTSSPPCSAQNPFILQHLSGDLLGPIPSPQPARFHSNLNVPLLVTSLPAVSSLYFGCF